jgi:RNA polymerase sigma factor (sigma-70 family)
MTCSITVEEWGAGIPAGGLVLYHLAEPLIPPPEQETRAETPGSLMTREELFLSQKAHIDRVVAWVCARRGLRDADAQDFRSLVYERLVENDYAVLGKFEGRSSLETYLAVVINRMYLDFQNARFGKWRHSAEARRRGPVALRLERLVYRDGYTFDEAVGNLQTNDHVTQSREELHAIFVALPCRPSRRARSSATATHEASTIGDGPVAVERAEREALARRIFAVIRRVLADAPALDRLFLRLHLESGLTIADAARALGEDQKALYRRRDAYLRTMRLALEAEGIRAEDVHELLATMDWQAALSPDAEESGPSRKEGEP